ncbi:MAG TPA: hypothetical protein VMN58_03040 [Acidimicrobiales bacterium]|nr:hypothetical protein [Acidimicrobiales bacterium]
MSLVVLLVLAMVWAVFLVPQLLRARAERGPADSIGAFRNQLSVLERTTPPVAGNVTRLRPVATHVSTQHQASFAPRPRATYGPSPRAMVRKRRKDILSGLLAAMGGSLVLGMIPGLRVMLALHLVLDLLFVGYIVMLVQVRNMAAERDMKVRFLPGPASVEPAMLLRRSASN